MGPSVQPFVTPRLVSRRYRGLVSIAILAGMAAAAAFVVIESLSTFNLPMHASTGVIAKPAAKPSVFGSVIPAAKAPDIKLPAPQIVKSGNRAVVTVTGYDSNDKPLAQGAGFVYSTNGMIATSFDAIRGASAVKIVTAAGEELSVIALMGYNMNADLAVLAVLEGNLPALESGASEIVSEGDPVVSIGPDNAFSNGTVGARRATNGIDMMPITAQAPEGAPVLNEQAKVIGMAIHKRVGKAIVTLAVPSHYITDLVAEHRVLSFEQMLEETQPDSGNPVP